MEKNQSWVSSIPIKLASTTLKLVSKEKNLAGIEFKDFSSAAPFYAGDTTFGGPNAATGPVSGPAIKIYSNGSGTVDGNLRSSDTGDEINFAFNLRDSGNNFLFHAPMINIPITLGKTIDTGKFPAFNSPEAFVLVQGVWHFDISDAGIWKPVHWDFLFDPALYGATDHVEFGYTG